MKGINPLGKRLILADGGSETSDSFTKNDSFKSSSSTPERLRQLDDAASCLGHGSTTTTTAAPAFVVHGTYTHALEGDSGIRRCGLSRMARNHIHMAKGLNGEGEENARGRMSYDCSVYIWVGHHRGSHRARTCHAASTAVLTVCLRTGCGRAG